MENMETAVEDKRTQTLMVLGVAMQKNGLAELALNYSGSGDEQDNFSVTCKTEDGKDVFVNVSEITDAMEALAETVVDGYENGNGGSGNVSIKIENLAINAEWDHFDNVTEESPEDTSIPDETAKMIRNILPALGADSVRVEYSGGGDSMDGLDITYSHRVLEIDMLNGVEVLTKRVHDALRNLICNQVDGFWNDEGGRGEMWITTDAENAGWDHFNFVGAHEQTHYSFSATLPVDQGVVA